MLCDPSKTLWSRTAAGMCHEHDETGRVVLSYPFNLEPLIGLSQRLDREFQAELPDSTVRSMVAGHERLWQMWPDGRIPETALPVRRWQRRAYKHAEPLRDRLRPLVLSDP